MAGFPVLVPVRSSQIKAVGYDVALEVFLVEFSTKTKRSLYAYANVKPSDVAAIVFADSLGSAFGRGIKADPAKFPYRRLERDEVASVVTGNVFDVDWIDGLEPLRNGRTFGGKA